MPTVGSLVQARPVFSVQHGATVLDAIRFMAEKNIGAVAVLEGARLVGIFSERDVITRVVSKELNPKATLVEKVMTKELVVAAGSETEESCLRKMMAANCRHLPVVEGGLLIGLLSVRDLLQVELTEREEKLEFLTSYLFHLPPDAEHRAKS